MKNTQYRKTTIGFALIELLVVASIISLLTSVTLVSVDTARIKARVVAVNLNVKSLFNESALYYADNNSYIATEASGPCGTLDGFLTTERSQQVIAEIESLSGLSATSDDFYCHIEEDEWSLALSTVTLNRDNEVMCASTRRGQILVIENSDDTQVEDYLTNGNCILE